MKQVIKKIAGRLGYEIRRKREEYAIEQEAAKTVDEKVFYQEFRTHCPIFSPWTGHSSAKIVQAEEVRGNTLVSADRRYMLYGLATHCTKVDGDFAEAGVWRGGTAYLLASVIANSDKKLHLFDSFEGLSSPNGQHDNAYKEGDFKNASLEHVQEVLKKYEAEVEMHHGWIPDTFKGLESGKFSFVHVDVDLYQPALDSCEFFYPRLSEGGIMVFDDYGFPACRGEKVAVDKYFKDKDDEVISLPTGQGLVMKT